MKKALLFAILALSINVFAQCKQPELYLEHPASNSLENIQGMMKDGGWKTSDIYTEKNSGQAIKHQTLQQRSLIQIYDSIYNWIWDSSIGWKMIAKTINIVYDANNNLTSRLRQNWNGSAWVNSIQWLLTYDANNNLTGELAQLWNGSVWENEWLATSAYDASNNLISNLNQIWNGSTWENSDQGIYTYNANNYLTSGLYQYWNGNAWVNNSQTTFGYDVNNNLTSELTQIWNGSTWVNYRQYTSTYDTNNNQISELGQIWNGSDWVNDWKYNYTYDANNNQISGLEQSWNGIAWENYSQYTSNYDVNNNLTSRLYQMWNGSDWVNSSQLTYTYDSDNFTVSYSNIYWNDAGTVITDGDSSYYYFHTVVVGINELTGREDSITVYPNPGNGKFTIISNATISSIEIFNLPGERIYYDFKFDQQTSTEIDLTNQAKGIYFIIIYNETKIYSRKIIVR